MANFNAGVTIIFAAVLTTGFTNTNASSTIETASSTVPSKTPTPTTKPVSSNKAPTTTVATVPSNKAPTTTIKPGVKETTTNTDAEHSTTDPDSGALLQSPTIAVFMLSLVVSSIITLYYSF